MVLCPSVYHCGYFPPYKASFILAAKKFRKLIFKHMLLLPASLADENWLFLTKKEGIIFCSNDIKGVIEQLKEWQQHGLDSIHYMVV